MICSKCQCDKPESVFRRNRKVCNDCGNLERKERYWNNLERERAKTKRWRETGDNAKKKLLQNRCANVGINVDQLRQMFVAQDGKCAICSVGFPSDTEFHIDHNHTTGQVRQLLCSNCNTGIGLFKERQELLLKAVEYLNKWNS